MIARAEQLQLMTVASRAPSAHNTQPARLRFLDSGHVALYEDLRRRLHVGDPEGRDALVSLGATLEALHLALGPRGQGVTGVERADLTRGQPVPPDMRCVAVATIGRGHPDELSQFIERRRSYRGVFVPARSELDAFVAASRGADDVLVVSAPNTIDEIAALHDACTHDFMRDRRYHEELWHWMRLTLDDPRWARDGLSADCLALGATERTAARLLMRPAVFSLLDRVGAGAVLLSEARQVRSASGIVILHRPQDEDVLVTGRRFYRLWLEITGAGLHLCPMSALADSATGQRTLHEWLGIGGDRRVINAFRVGMPSGPVAASARLPAEELLV